MTKMIYLNVHTTKCHLFFDAPALFSRCVSLLFIVISEKNGNVNNYSYLNLCLLLWQPTIRRSSTIFICFSFQEKNRIFMSDKLKICGSDCWFIEQTLKKIVPNGIFDRFTYDVHTLHQHQQFKIISIKKIMTDVSLEWLSTCFIESQPCSCGIL